MHHGIYNLVPDIEKKENNYVEPDDENKSVAS